MLPFAIGLASGAGLACGVWMVAATPSSSIDSVILREKLHEAEMRLASAEVARNEAARRRDEAADRLSVLHHDLSIAGGRLREADAALSAAETQRRVGEDERRRLAAERDAAVLEARSLRLALAEAEGRQSGMTASFGSIGNAIDRVIAERDFAMARSVALADSVAALQAEKNAVVARESALITDLQSMASHGIDGLERMFGAAKIDVDALTAEVGRDYSGQGGPFEGLTVASLDTATPENARIGTLMSDLERLSLMHFAAERVPFAKPVRGARLTSGFGPRRDPLRRRFSMHNGIDFAGPRGTPILATASGVVTFVGRQRGYGKVVEIRHAFGFQTLYAHLSKTRVRLGERVEKGDRIGDMGNTGRSTGVHVHYEVRLNDSPVNPMTFIEAARDVL